VPDFGWGGGLTEPSTLLCAERPDVDVDVVVLEAELTSERGRRLLTPFEVEGLVSCGYRVVLYTFESRPLVLGGLLAAGARAVVHKSQRPEALAEVLARVTEGRCTEDLLGGFASLVRHGVPTLTDRQREVLTGRINGESWRNLSEQMFITQTVAREHLAAGAVKIRPWAHGGTVADLGWAVGISPGDTFRAWKLQRQRMLSLLAAQDSPVN